MGFMCRLNERLCSVAGVAKLHVLLIDDAIFQSAVMWRTTIVAWL